MSYKSKRCLTFNLILLSLLFIACTLGFSIINNGKSLAVSFKSIVNGVITSTTVFILILMCGYVLGSAAKRLKAKSICAAFLDIYERLIWNQWFLPVLFLFCWLPYYLAAFPGLFIYDAVTQIHYALDLKIVNSFHPLIHTYWMVGCIRLAQLLFKSETIGFAIYTLTQMIVMSCLFSYCIRFMSKQVKSALLTSLLILFISLFPLFPILAISATKDSVFSALLPFFVVSLYECFGYEGSLNNTKVLQLIISAVALCLFRNNAIYVVFVTVLLLVFLKPLRAKFRIRFSLLLLVSCCLFSVFIPKLLSNRTSDITEPMGVPIQQVCAVLNSRDSNVSNEEADEIKWYLPNWGSYNPYICDPVKFSPVSNKRLSDNPARFLKLWINVGLKNPGVYFDAFLKLTVNFWCPSSSYNASEITKPYLEYDQWDYVDNDKLGRWLGPAGYDVFNITDNSVWTIIHRHSLLPIFENTIREICYNPIWNSNLILYALTSPALIFLCFISSIVVSMLNKDIKSFLLLFIPTLYYLSCFLGPCYLVRYSFPLYCSLPVLAVSIKRLFVDCEAQHDLMGQML